MATVVKFTTYLHGDLSTSELVAEIADQAPQLDTATLAHLEATIGRPFYEVQLDCELDVDAGRVTIVGVDGKDVR